MTLYVNRLRYKYGAPTLGASSGIVNQAFYNGISFYDDDWHEPEIDYAQEYLTFESLEDNNVITFNIYGSATISSVSYSLDNGSNWTTQTNRTAITLTINRGETIKWKASATRWGGGNSSYSYFSATKYFNVYGNVGSLVWNDNFIGQTSWTNTSSHFLNSLFQNNTKVIDAGNMVIPFDVVKSGDGLRCIFSGCSNLIRAPRIDLNSSSNATTVLCQFFDNCSSLIHGPILWSPYANQYLYAELFRNCTSLKKIICLATSKYTNGTNDWVQGVNSSGKFLKAQDSSLFDSTGNAARPTNFSLSNYYDNYPFVKVKVTPNIPYSCYVKGISDFYEVGESCTLTIVPLNGYTFSGFYLNETLVSNSSTYTFTVTGDTNLEVRLTEPQQYTVTLSVNDSNMGSASGGGTYYENTSVTVTASPSTGYGLVGWYNNGTLVSTSSNYTFTLTGNVSLEARFEALQQYTVTLSVNDANMGSASGSGTYYEGTSVTVTASPSTGYRLVGWYSGSSLDSTSTTYTFTLTENVSLEAVFEVYTVNQVSYIKTSTVNTSNTPQYYFDTGISSGPNTGTIEIDLEFMPLGNNGDVFFGHMGGGYYNSSDNYDFRMFWYSNSVYCDVGNGRVNTSSSSSFAAFNSLKQWTWTIDYANKTYNVKRIGYTSFLDGTFTYNPNQHNIYINLSPMKFKSIIIKKDNVVVFNGFAALDANNVPCIYDTISGSYKYNIGSSGNSGLSYEINYVTCQTCGGTGTIIDYNSPCPECNGTGMVTCDYCSGSGNQTCQECGGEGQIWDDEEEEYIECPTCQGSGETPCDNCQGQGEVPCEECDAEGYLSETCPTCNGAGRILN